MAKIVAAFVHFAVLLLAAHAFAGKANGEPCSTGAECMSTFCVEGVCCDSVCNQTCNTCTDPKGPGTCTMSKTVPVPPRTCAPLPSSLDATCAAMGCNGGPGYCVPQFGPNGKECRPAKCEDNGTFMAAGKCSDGTCSAVTPISCSPFKCAASGCLKSCTADADCLGGFLCKVGNCIAGNFTCTADQQGSLNADRVVTDCSPYLCGEDGRCRESCRTSAECAPDSVCDAASSKCVPSSTSDSSGGGCTLVHASSTGASALPTFAVLGLVARRRWRTRRPKTSATFLARTVVAVLFLMAGACGSPALGSSMRSNFPPDTKVEVACEGLDRGSNGAANNLQKMMAARYADGWRLAYATEYTSTSRPSIPGIYCFERAAK